MAKSGFVAIIGRPNVGKSTFLNTILEKKVSIVSDVPQTTRNNIKGILTREHGQIVFIDTPGLHKVENKLNSFMVSETLNIINDADLILFFISPLDNFNKIDEFVLKTILNRKVILVINKIDLNFDKNHLIKRVVNYTEKYEFIEVLYISAKMKTNVDSLEKIIFKHLEDGPFYYNTNQVVEYSDEFWITELIREKLFYFLKQELPHNIAVLISNIIDNEHELEIYVDIYVNRDSQKGIIIGKGGSLVKKIKELTLRNLKLIFQKKIFLDINVKVEKNWISKNIQKMGYNKNG